MTAILVDYNPTHAGPSQSLGSIASAGDCHSVGEEKR